jgi:hypothetical protein
MKLHIVHDAKGKILAAADVTSGTNGPRPRPGKGHHELIVEVPTAHRGMTFLEICKGLRVDTKSKTLAASGELADKKQK